MRATTTRRILAANERLIGHWQLDAIGEYFAADYVAHLTRRDMRGQAAVRRFLRELQRAFPRLRVEVEVLAVAKDRVAWQRTLRGVQKGDLQGFPATGRQIVWRDMIVSRLEGGLFTEDWVISDLAEQLLRARRR